MNIEVLLLDDRDNVLSVFCAFLADIVPLPCVSPICV